VVKRLRNEGVKVGLLRLKTLWPFPEEAVAEVGKRAKKVLVPEMNQGQVAGEVKKYCSCDVIPLSQTNGEVIRPETIIEALRKI
jgi:2-oxoglutarate ferredoxin oxidoreductase subunit alpha